MNANTHAAAVAATAYAIMRGQPYPACSNAVADDAARLVAAYQRLESYTPGWPIEAARRVAVAAAAHA